VPREVVAAEATRGPVRVAGPAGRPPPGDVRRPAGPRNLPAARPRSRFGAKAERQVLRAMIGSPEWRDVGRQELAPELFESVAFRELYLALGRLDPSDAGGQLPEGLSPDAAALWSELKSSAAELAAEQLAEEYLRAQQTLAARPELLAIRAIKDPTELQRRYKDLGARYPLIVQTNWYAHFGERARERQRRP
jgi:hypothetical protein